jgi:hypothetical protein
MDGICDEVDLPGGLTRQPDVLASVRLSEDNHERPHRSALLNGAQSHYESIWRGLLVRASAQKLAIRRPKDHAQNSGISHQEFE